MGQGVALIGFMGSGKSTLGSSLANRLGSRFCDLDGFIEQREGLTVELLFEQRGEVGFREAERLALEASLANTSQVLACGGGTPCQNGLMDALLEWGSVIFLDVPFEDLKRRTMDGRPLWNAKAEALYAQRRPVYERAHIRLDGTLSPEVLLEAAVQCLEMRT